MPRYQYVAMDAQGNEVAGTIDASSTNEAVAQLRQGGYFPTSVYEEGKAPADARVARRPRAAKAAVIPGAKARAKGVTLFQRKKVRSRTLMIFTRQLATLIDSGLPLLRGLTVLGKQERDPALKTSIERLAESVQGGNTFSESLAQHPGIFNKLYVNMVKAGELGGVLEVVLTRLAEFQEKAQRVRNKVVAAMFYPVVVFFIAMAILVFLLTFIVPRFQQIFKEMLGNKPLPGLTQGVINVSEALKQHLVWVILGIVLLIVIYQIFSRTSTGRRVVDSIKLNMPLFGDLVRKSAISRFSRTLGTLVTSGVPILQALNITKETAGNVVIADAISKVHDSVKEGESIVQPLEVSGVFPPMVISMIDVGEETGQLPEMLLKIADVYDDEVDSAVAGLTSLLEPIMIVFLALVVGTIVIALFLPLIEIIRNLQGGAGG